MNGSLSFLIWKKTIQAIKSDINGYFQVYKEKKVKRKV